MKKPAKEGSKQNSSKQKQSGASDLEEHLIYAYKYGEEKKFPSWMAVVSLIVIIAICICYKISLDLKTTEEANHLEPIEVE